MTHSDLTQRNRSNAAKSTGPKTPAGKSASSQNARRHGATGAPDPSAVATWLSIILCRPQIFHSDLMPSDEAGIIAITLAQAEARLAAAEDALAEWEAAEASQMDGGVDDLDELTERAMAAIRSPATPPSQRRSIVDGIAELIMRRHAKSEEEARRHRLLTRYAREARSARSRAIAAWSAHTAGSCNQAGAGS
jgi:hypothetical protein